MNWNFLLKFFFIFLILQYAILNIELQPLEKMITEIEGKATGLEYGGNILIKGNTAFKIAPNCTGLLNSAILVALVFAFNRPSLEKKLRFLAMGIPILLLLNITRIYLILMAPEQYISTLHTFSWFVNAGFVLILWYYFNKTELKLGKK